MHGAVHIAAVHMQLCYTHGTNACALTARPQLAPSAPMPIAAAIVAEPTNNNWLECGPAALHACVLNFSSGLSICLPHTAAAACWLLKQLRVTQDSRSFMLEHHANCPA
jgi:hypothetical protein